MIELYHIRTSCYLIYTWFWHSNSNLMRIRASERIHFSICDNCSGSLLMVLIWLYSWSKNGWKIIIYVYNFFICLLLTYKMHSKPNIFQIKHIILKANKMLWWIILKLFKKYFYLKAHNISHLRTWSLCTACISWQGWSMHVVAHFLQLYFD